MPVAGSANRTPDVDEGRRHSDRPSWPAAEDLAPATFGLAVANSFSQVDARTTAGSKNANWKCLTAYIDDATTGQMTLELVEHKANIIT
jgi:hypothetical protein